MFVHRHTDGKDQYDRAMSAVRGSPDLIELGKDGRGEDRFTSRDMIDTEPRLQRASELLAQRERHRVSEGDRESAIRAGEARGRELAGAQGPGLERASDGQGWRAVV